MTSAKRSNSAKSAAKSNASSAGVDESVVVARVAARGAAACDMLGVPHGSATIVVACSGGADSAAALHVVRRARPEARIIACYVDHGLRGKPSIARDRRAVVAQARNAKAETAFVRLRERPARGASIEAALRVSRYRALAELAASVGARCVVTGHQRDDIAESTVMALARGSGIDGIAAMRPRRAIGRGVDVVRPLLWAPKSVLATYAGAAGLVTSADETNDDPRFRRNAIRALLAGLESAVRGSSRAIARSAAIAIEDKALLDAVTAAAWIRCVADDGNALVAAKLRALPAALLRRVLRLAVKRVLASARDFSYEHCAAIEHAIRERRGGTYHAGRARVILSGGRMVALDPSATVSNPGAAVEVTVPRSKARIAWSGGSIELRLRKNAGRPPRAGDLALDAAKLAPGTILTVRLPGGGDHFVPAGRHSPVRLARFLAKAGLSREERRGVPLLCSNGTIVAVLGVRADAGFIARPGRQVLEVRWQPANAPRPQR